MNKKYGIFEHDLRELYSCKNENRYDVCYIKISVNHDLLI